MNSLIIILYINKLIFSNNILCENIATTANSIVKIIDNELEKEYIGLSKTIEGHEINYFVGIPYAKPPVGALRFKRAVPFKYQPVTDATKWRHSCYPLISIDLTGLMKGITKSSSEDCLHLNIWAPKVIPGQQLKAVMINLHGGGFMAGTGTADVLNGEMISGLSDVVVVTINYRTNVFGFLYSGTSEAPGNVGLWDQILAFEWVRDNIKSFGGDPNRVTIFGAGSGAWSVSLHILSPVSRHLFRNAILISGSSLTHLSGDDPKKVITRWNLFAQELNCGNGSDINEIKTINCLRKYKAKELYETFISRRDFISDFIGYVPLVVYGNEFLPKEPIDLLKSNDFKHNFSLLSGYAKNEGFLFVQNYDYARWTSPDKNYFSKTNGVELLRHYISLIRTDKPINFDIINQIYLSQIHENNTDLVKERIGEAIGDFYFTCPTNLFNEYIYSDDTANNKVFQYLFSAKPKSTQSWCPEPLGACHATEMYMIFGHPLRYPNQSTETERVFSKSIINTFAYFAKNDKPPAQYEIDWSSFYKYNNTNYLVKPYYQFLLEPKPNVNFGFSFKDYECTNLWKLHVENQ